MKISMTLLILSLSICSLPLGGSTSNSGYAAGFQAAKSRPLYRYRSKKGNLLYSVGAEVPKSLTNGPWRNDGIVCHVAEGPNHQFPAKAVYQLVKSDDLGVRYAYTGNSGEANPATGWSNTGIAFYILAQQQPGMVPLFRLYKPFPLPAEKNLIDKLNDAIWGVDVKVPIGANADTNFYTSDPSIKAEALGKGYQDQGILGYVWTSPYPPSATALSDLIVFSTTADESSVTAILMNKGKANTGGVKYQATLKVFDQDGKVSFQTTEPAPGLSPNQKNQLIFKVPANALRNKRYQVIVDSANVLEESDESNNESQIAEGPRKNLITPKVDPDAVRPPSIVIASKKDEKAKDGTDRTTFTLSVTNWDQYPAEWFRDVTIMPPASCNGAPTSAQLLLFVFAQRGDKQYRAGCKPLHSPLDLKTVSTIAFGGQMPLPDKIYVVLEDRVVGGHYTSSSVVVGALGIDEVLFPLGCKRFLGRSTDFLCSKKIGLEACENLKKQGKPITCRATGDAASK